MRARARIYIVDFKRRDELVSSHYYTYTGNIWDETRLRTYGAAGKLVPPIANDIGQGLQMFWPSSGRKRQ
jgi:hypothetical protein